MQPRTKTRRIWWIPADTAPRPTIASVSPSSGLPAGGTSVTITGTGFEPRQGNLSQVRFGTALGTNLVVVSDTTATVDSPAGTGTVPVWVKGPGGESPLANAFTNTAIDAIMTELGADLETEAAADLLTET